MKVRVIEVDLDVNEIKEFVKQVIEEKMLEKKEDNDVCEITIQFDDDKNNEKDEKEVVEKNKENRLDENKKDKEDKFDELKNMIKYTMAQGNEIDKEKLEKVLKNTNISDVVNATFEALIEEIDKQKKKNEDTPNKNN